MKKFLTLLIFALFAQMAFAAGSVTVTQNVVTLDNKKPLRVMEIAWVGDASNGTVPSTDLTSYMADFYGTYLLQIVTDPGSTAPTTGYDIVLQDATGLDITGGVLADRDDADTEVAFPLILARPIDSPLTFTLTGNSVPSATGLTKLYFSDTPAGGTINVTGGTGGTSSTDDATFIAGTGVGTPMMGFATSDTVNSGDVGVVGMDTNRNVKVSIEVDNAGIGGGTQYDEDTGHISGDTGTMALTVRQNTAAALADTQGDYQPFITDGNGKLWVVDSAAGLLLGTIDADTSTLATTDFMLGTDFTTITGSTTDAKNPATDTTSVGVIALLKQMSYSLQSIADGGNVSGALTTRMTGTTSTQVIPGVASNYLYITSCSFSNDDSATSTEMRLQDGASGTTLWAGDVPHATTDGHPGGREVTFGDRGLKVPTSGNGLYVVNVTTGSSTIVSCNGYKSTVSY